MSKQANPTLVGGFVIAAALIALAATAFFGSGNFFTTRVPFALYFENSVNGLSVGAPVKYKGVEVGRVRDILLNLDQIDSDRIPVIIELEPDRILQKGGAINLEDPGTAKLLIDQGLRAQLQAQSLVTGLLYVALDVFPESKARFVAPPWTEYQEIPTLATAFEQARTAAGEIINELRNIRFAELIDSAIQTVDGVRSLVGSPALQTSIDAIPPILTKLQELAESQEVREAVESLPRSIHNIERVTEDANGLVMNLNQSVTTMTDDLKLTTASARQRVVDLEGTLASVTNLATTLQALVAPESPFSHQLTSTLDEISGAARGVRELADYLERNPAALVRGRDTYGE